MTAVAAALLLTLACLGAGAAVLRALRVLPHPGGEAAAWSFVIGLGVVGWILFVSFALGPFAYWPFALLLTLCALGVALLPRPRLSMGAAPAPIGIFLGAVLVAVLCVDLAEALSPMADADSLAYHFALPKRYVAEGLVFETRAVEGAVPLLIQMLTAAALGLGGERAATLWAMISGWGAALLLYTVARHRLSPSWSLALALCWQTVPTVTYAAGTGQIEVRTAMFTLLGLLAAAQASTKADWRYSATAGLAAGFFAASKYPGLVYAVGMAVPLVLCSGRWLRVGSFAVAMLVAGSQWYLWNWWNTGDPLFPMLYGLLPYHDGVPWNAEQTRHMSQVFAAGELALPRDLFNSLAYPFLATVMPLPAFDAGRAGLGPFPLVMLPFALAGMRTGRLSGLVARMTIGVIVVYAVWFLFGPSQRVRHLLPLMPVVILTMGFAAAGLRTMRGPVWAGLIAVMVVQLAAQAVIGIKYVRYLVSDQSRSDFLAANIGGYEAARWLNAHLGADDKVILSKRELPYLLDIPYFYANNLYQAEVEVRGQDPDVERFWKQARRKGITHILTADARTAQYPSPDTNALPWLAGRLLNLNCAEVLATTDEPIFESRTLGNGGQRLTMTILRLRNHTGCPLHSSAPAS
ncbi:MAG: glycosyltransferase family 39 protein [Magnetospirillum sp.]|nr:glycosyltransferase family 39 protein [Magnetospirillum sp.]